MKRNAGLSTKTVIRKLFFYIALIATVLFFMMPIYHFATMSIKTEVDAFASPPKWFFVPTLEHYKSVFGEIDYTRSLLNSIIISFCTVLFSLVIGLPAAYALSRLKFKVKNAILVWILSTTMLPPMSIILPYYLIYMNLHLLDTRTGMVIIYLTLALPLTVWMMKTFFDDVPLALEEAARIDGCSTFGIFMRISIPVVSHGIMACAVFSWITAWNEFLFGLILTRKFAKPATVGIMMFSRFEDIKWGAIAAGSVTIMFPVLVFSFFMRKFLIQGLTKGALKE